VLEQAIVACELAGDEYGLALSWRRLGWVRQVEGRYGPAAETLERAIVHARNAGHVREETLGLAMLAMSLALGPTFADAAISRCRTILEQSPTEIAPQAPAAASSLAFLHAMQGEIEEARTWLALGWDVLEPFGDRHAVANGSHMTGLVELFADDPEAAEARLRRGYETLTAMGDTSFLAPIVAALAEALYRLGRNDAALAFAEEAASVAAPDSFGTQAAWRSTKARVLAARGEHIEGERLAREAVRLAEQTDVLADQGNAALTLAHVLRAAGPSAEASALAERATALFEQKGDLVDAARARALRDELAAVTP
jgi:tetratricopeptide (TPR) repeat protein